VVETAVPLPEDLHTGLRTRLVKLYGPALVTQFTVTPGLIGGMRIRVGSDVYDGSVKSELDALRNRF
jgi:F-type H+-transporting ATPase subunit delta